MSKNSTSEKPRIYRPANDVENVMGSGPETITTLIRCMAKAFDWLDETFQVVDEAAKAGDLDRVRRIAPMGRHLAEDYANFSYTVRSEMLEAMRAVGLEVGDD